MANINFRDPGEKAQAARPVLYDKIRAAEYLRVSPRKLEYMMADGRVKYGKLGGSVVFRQRDLDAALEKIFEEKGGKSVYTPGNYS